LREYIENLRNILRTCWKHNGDIVENVRNAKNPKKEKTSFSGKTGPLGERCITSLAEQNFHT
jgi:hypothetical protein